VLVFGPVRDQEENSSRAQGVDQSVQHRLGLGVYPLEILEDKQQRHGLGPAQCQGLYAIQNSAPTFRGIETVPFSVLDWKVEN
jgi:hypothetical protein